MLTAGLVALGMPLTPALDDGVEDEEGGDEEQASCRGIERSPTSLEDIAYQG